MATELLYIQEDNTLSFGDYTLSTKKKVEDFEFQGDIYKVKTFAEITKLEKNGMFVYESVPGTAVSSFKIVDDGMTFAVCGNKDVQITVELEPKQEYKVILAGKEMGTMATNLSGKLSISMELQGDVPIALTIIKQ
ncbi:MAG: endosialidase [Eubacteriales bacterium]